MKHRATHDEMDYRINKILEYTDWLQGKGQGKMGGGHGLYAAFGALLGNAGPYSQMVKNELMDEFGCSERQYERYVKYAWQTQGYKNRHKWYCNLCGGTVRSRRDLGSHSCFEETIAKVKETHGEEVANDPKIQQKVKELVVDAWEKNGNKLTFSRISGLKV